MRRTQTLLSAILSVAVFSSALNTFFLPAADSNTAGLKLPWDWSGVIGTGQSLAVGDHGKPIKSTNQPYANLKLSTGGLPWPIDPADTSLAMTPLVEPVGRLAHRYPSSWPDNIAGETPHSAMANEISALVKAASGRDFVGVHGEVGENGQCMTFLKKGATERGVNGHSYEAALIETKAITRLAKAAGKTYGIGAIIITHGECDAGNQQYESELYQLWSDYNTDLRAITGQSQNLQMIVSQQNSQTDGSTLAQWRAGVDHPDDIVCSGPKYQYEAAEGIHLTTDGYQQLGEKYGQVYYQRVVLGNPWQPLQPTGIERVPLPTPTTVSGSGVFVTNTAAVLKVHFHVPAPPLAWDATYQTPHESVEEWKLGRGFEVTTASRVKVTIRSAEISGDTVILTCSPDPGPNARVSYATVGEKVRMTTPFGGTFRWGQLRDSDPFVGEVTKKPQPNYCVAFEMTAP